MVKKYLLDKKVPELPESVDMMRLSKRHASLAYVSRAASPPEGRPVSAMRVL